MPLPPGCAAREWSGALIALSTTRLERALLTAVVLLIALGILTVSVHEMAIEDYWVAKFRDSFVRLFSLDQEANVPTWYASATLLFASGLALVISRMPPRADAGKWALVGCLLLLMSLDESAVLHEMMILPLRGLLETGGLLYYAWVIPGGLLAMVVALYLSPFLWRLDASVRQRLILGGSLFVLGALGVEALSGWVEEVRGRDRLFFLLVVVEESFEMLGVLLAISAFLRHLALVPQTIQLRVVR